MKEIKDFPGYSITEKGEILSHRKPISDGTSFYSSIDYNMKARSIKQNLNSSGYPSVGLMNKNGKRVTKAVHRLVAETYIENPNNLECVNHKNEIKTDNRVENLEWCTKQYNAEYSLADRFLIENPDGDLIEVYNLNEFARENNFNVGGNFSTGKVRSKGYKVVRKLT
jgi:hypothetical protein